MEFISDRAERYTAGGDAAGRGSTGHDAARHDAAGHDADTEPLAPRQELERSLLLEFQDRPEVRENSTAWGELRATAVFDPDLREALAEARLTWIGELTDPLGRIHRASPALSPHRLRGAAHRRIGGPQLQVAQRGPALNPRPPADARDHRG